MSTTYNLFSGQSLERLAALSDGVFAVAMTLLVLDLHAPTSASIHGEHDLWRALIALAPNLVTYLMTFLTLGIFWVGQQTQLNQLERSDRDLAWIHIGFLLLVTLTPFSTQLLAEFITYRLALAVYWLNIFLLGAVLFASWRHAIHAKLTKDTATPTLQAAVERRIVVAQSLYAAGALLCILSTYLSIAIIVLIQLNYVVAPRLRLLYHLGAPRDFGKWTGGAWRGRVVGDGRAHAEAWRRRRWRTSRAWRGWWRSSRRSSGRGARRTRRRGCWSWRWSWRGGCARCRAGC